MSLVIQNPRFLSSRSLREHIASLAEAIEREPSHPSVPDLRETIDAMQAVLDARDAAMHRAAGSGAYVDEEGYITYA